MPRHTSSPHMIIHKRVWHYRLFCWALSITDAWRGSNGHYEERFEYGTSLFHYLRVILFYAPMAILSNAALIVWVIFSLFIIPVQVGGVGQYLAFWGLLFVLAMVLFGLWFLVHVWSFSEDSSRKKYTPGLADMVKRYVRSRRNKVTPLITFVERGE